MKILNLYAGIGGNRKLWGNEHDVTAVERDVKIAQIYAEFFPDDLVIVDDAHQYLLEHYKEFDFIWSSPPCPSHSVTNNFLNAQGVIRYPDMKLYEEIIFLRRFCRVPFCVENVKSYYYPLIRPYVSGRHYFWANFRIPLEKDSKKDIGRFGKTRAGRKEEKNKLKRNCVNSKLGLAIFKAAFKQKQEVLI